MMEEDWWDVNWRFRDEGWASDHDWGNVVPQGWNRTQNEVETENKNWQFHYLWNFDWNWMDEWYEDEWDGVKWHSY